MNFKNTDHEKLLYYYKQSVPGLKTGISIPADVENYRAIFSFGFKFNHLQIQEQSDKLLALGKFSLQKILKVIPLNQQGFFNLKPHLKLIVNNQVNHE